MLKKYGDIIAGTILLIVAILVFRSSFEIKTTIPVRLGADFMPKVVSILLGLLSVVLIVSNVIKVRILAAALDGEQGIIEKHEQFKVLAVLAVISLYVIVLNKVGFIISTFLFLFIQMNVMANKGKRKYLLFLIIAAVASFAIYYLFRSVFRLYLPSGLFP